MKYLKLILIALTLALPSLTFALPVQWDRYEAGKIRPLNPTDSVYIPSLSDGCMQISGGLITTTGASCGSGSGSGDTN